MANKYHVNGETGRVNICRATNKRGCPLGADTPHFDNKEDAKQYIERIEENNHKKITTISKHPRDSIKKHSKIENNSNSNIKNIAKSNTIRNHRNNTTDLEDKNTNKSLNNNGVNEKFSAFSKPYVKKKLFTKDDIEFPDGSLVEFTVPPIYQTKKRLFGGEKKELISDGKIVRGRIIHNSCVVHDNANNIDVTIKSLRQANATVRMIYTAPVEELTKESAIRRDKELFDKEFKVGDTIEVFTNYGEPPDDVSSTYVLIENNHVKNSAVLQNKESGKILALKEADFLKSGQYGFVKIDDDKQLSDGSSMSNYLNGEIPYPLTSFKNPFEEINDNIN